MNSNFRHLEAAAVETDIEVLDKHQETASTFTKTLSDFLFAQQHSTGDIHHWHQELIRLADGDQGKPPETVIVVVGSMGAGKSTAINALIGEARLLPTSGYDACTSVATEVRYNYSLDPDEAYRAEITFITKVELLNELLILREDVLSTSEAVGSGTEAGAIGYDDTSHAEVAWDKIQAVWPRLTKAELAAPGFDVHALLEDPFVRVCLGETHQVLHPTAAGLCRDLEKFVANRDNAALARRVERVGAEQQLWPLVDKVNIFVKAEVLSTGAVIRDMPGGQDGNSARSSRAAAEGDKCDHLCVLVPIKRAISEQIVKKPFNDASTFKNWIKFDGRLGDITYVCTMTDDAIEIDRDAEEFGLVEHLEETRRLEQELDDCETALVDTREQLDALQVKSQVLEDTLASWTKSAGAKRKRSSTSETLRDKRLRRNPLPSSSEKENYMQKHDPEENEGLIETLTCVPEAGEAEEVAKKIEYLEEDFEALQRKLAQHNSFLKESCIQARNTLTRSAIRRDFVYAAKELLTRQGQSRPDATGEEPDGDYKIEPQPPMVHTVSARGYFESSKRHRREQFWTADTTDLSGIPAWRDHIKELTVPARRRRCQAFLKATLRCFNHMAMWCDNGSGIRLTSDQEKQELTIYKKDLDYCVKLLGFHFDAFIRECRDVFERLFSERMTVVMPKVIRTAIDVASTWPSRKRGDQLLTASSYRSACRRGGVYEGKGRVHKNPWDLNEELTKPLIDGIMDLWSDTFGQLLPSAFRDLKAKSAQVIYDLSDETEQRMQPNLTESARKKLRLQAMAQIESINEAIDVMRASLVGSDNRGQMRQQLAPELRREMRQTWKECVKTTGAGSFQRQQATVERHIRDRGAWMYTSASSRLERILLARCNTIEQTLQALKRSVDRDMWHAYKTCIVAKDDGNRATREELRRLLVEADGHFQA